MKHPRKRVLSPKFAKPAGNKGDQPPVWNLSLVFNGLHSKELAKEAEELEDRISRFDKTYNGRIAKMSGSDLGAAIEEYEYIKEKLSRISGYLELMVSEDRNTYTKTKSRRKWCAEMETKLEFFERGISDMREGDLLSRTAARELSVYAPWLASIRNERQHGLSSRVKALSDSLDHTSTESFRRLYHQEVGRLKFNVNEKSLNIEEVEALLDSESPETRTSARAETARVLRENSKIFAHILNSIAKDRLVENDWCAYTRPDASVNLSNQVDDEMVDTLFETVKASYATMAHRYFAWEKKEKERAAQKPPPPADAEDELIPWSEASETVLHAFRRFSPQFARLAKRFLEDGHTHAASAPNKEAGGFAMTLGPESHPYILVNYQGLVEDVATLAHELGHGIHFIMAERAQGFFLSQTSDPVSETASIFAEMLVFEEMMRREKDPEARRELLSEKVDGMLSSIHLQISYYDFEKRLYEERKKGELTSEQISDIWVATQKEYYGPTIDVGDHLRYSWMVVPHFYNTPFYVYSYAFAQILVSTLYQVYQEEGLKPGSDFAEKYVTFLETGISKNLSEALTPFGLDPKEPEFWEKGLSLLEKYIDQLEAFDTTDPKPAAPGKKPPVKPKTPKA